MFCNALGLVNGRYCTKLDVRFTRGKENRLLPIFLHHGFDGGRKSGANINNIHDLRSDHDASIYLIGHVHECGWAPMKPFMYTDFRSGEHKLRVKYRHFGLTGPYLKTYTVGHSSYSEMAAYPPTAVGSIYFDYMPRYDRVKEHTTEESGEVDG